MLRRFVIIACLVFPVISGTALADDVLNQIETARGAYAKGDGLKALSALQTAAQTIASRLSEQLGRVMPPPPKGWEAAAPEFQSLDSIGGGVAMTRGYTRGLATLNASLVVDNPAIAGSASLFEAAKAATAQPGWVRLRVGSEDALQRFDQPNRVGEILILIGGRALLQIEGTEIESAEILAETAKGWDIVAIRKLLGG